MTQNVFVIGGSRNIGYFVALRLLAAGANVLFLLRFPSAFDNDESIQQYVKSGKARLLKGDALVESDVRHGWEEAGKTTPVDLLLFTVGGKPHLHPLKGAVIYPPNLVTQSLLNVLATMPSPPPRTITVSAKGLTRSGHAALPLLLRALYGYLLTVPHADKLGSERAVAHCAGWDWNKIHDEEPSGELMGPDWQNRAGLPTPGALDQVLVVRPAALTDGECVAEKKRTDGKAPYRVSEDEFGGWTVSRKDVAYFIADVALNHWDEYVGKTVNIAY